jgi:hypothetical protein
LRSGGPIPARGDQEETGRASPSTRWAAMRSSTASASTINASSGAESGAARRAPPDPRRGSRARRPGSGSARDRRASARSARRPRRTSDRRRIGGFRRRAVDWRRPGGAGRSPDPAGKPGRGRERIDFEGLDATARDGEDLVVPQQQDRRACEEAGGGIEDDGEDLVLRLRRRESGSRGPVHRRRHGPRRSGLVGRLRRRSGRASGFSRHHLEHGLGRAPPTSTRCPPRPRCAAAGAPVGSARRRDRPGRTPSSTPRPLASRRRRCAAPESAVAARNPRVRGCPRADRWAP